MTIVGSTTARILAVRDLAPGPYDEVDLLVDTQLGVVRRIEARKDGAIVHLREVVRLFFDAPLHPATFVFAPRPQR